MPEKKLPKLAKFVEVESLKNQRFDFIENKILKENIAIKMQYIIFLVSLEEEYKLPGAITYSAFKTIIIFTASIVESLINYKLHELLKSGKIKENKVMNIEKKYPVIKELHKISPTERICGVKEVIKSKKISDDTNFIELNRAAKRSDLFTEGLFKKAEEIREMRNRIHLFGLKEIDDKYTKKDITNIFTKTRDIIQRIESY